MNLIQSKPDLLLEIKSALFGLAVGDALGVPVEFTSRSSLKNNPVTGMREYGTYKLPAGTWSDDSSLAFCLTEALSDGFDLDKVAKNFIRWESQGYWTPYGEVFDIGIATRQAINRLKRGTKPEFSGGADEQSNGNGSLMRILPLVFYIKDKPLEERFGLTRQVSSITHGHIRSVIACFYYLEFARLLLKSLDKYEIYSILSKEIPENLSVLGIDGNDLSHFGRLQNKDICNLQEDNINSGGYVVDTLEAGIWCLLTTDSYPEAVLKAVNLGADTDTTACVTGGLAGLLYGHEQIPKEWIDVLARKDDIEGLCDSLSHSLL